MRLSVHSFNHLNAYRAILANIFFLLIKAKRGSFEQFSTHSLLTNQAFTMFKSFLFGLPLEDGGIAIGFVSFFFSIRRLIQVISGFTYDLIRNFRFSKTEREYFLWFGMDDFECNMSLIIISCGFSYHLWPRHNLCLASLGRFNFTHQSDEECKTKFHSLVFFLNLIFFFQREPNRMILFMVMILIGIIFACVPLYFSPLLNAANVPFMVGVCLGFFICILSLYKKLKKENLPAPEKVETG